MCYHVSTPAILEIEKQFPDFSIEGDIQQYYHVSGFERPYLPVTTNAQPHLITTARWKLIPHFVRTETAAKQYANTLNAHCGEIYNKTSYKPYIGKRHGLLYINGFYEPHILDGQRQSVNYYIYGAQHEIMTLGIVYSTFRDEGTGTSYDTFSILTVDANEMMSEIYNEKLRMPLIVPAGDRMGWLNASAEDEVKSFFKPYQGELKAHQIATRVTALRGVNTNVPEIQKALPKENQSILF
ncbi:SOS response-associated peptidase family protein [uncultured Pedobacter sp.]|uniref:SOS response-associated peptidase n=1 Tax=uncultured Pedobacter sp. TaxID=246139 RepID=UPI00261E7101|nr:SOS response-associated peptidase family protein [uncultured Pedobacter sp.]